MKQQALPEGVLILGASGFAGRALEDWLERGGETCALGLSTSECDLRDPEQTAEQLGQLDGEFAVVLAAARTRERADSWRDFWQNVAIVRNVLDRLPRARVRSLIYLSSVCVYGTAHAGAIDEESALEPEGYYALSKRMGEDLVRFRPDRSFPATCLRLPGVYGPGDGGRSVVGRLAAELRERQSVRLSGGGRTRRDFLAVEDLCRVVEQLLREPYDGALNAVTGESTRVRELAGVVAEALGLPCRIEPTAAGARDRDLVFDPARVRALCPDVAWTPLAQGVRRYLAEPHR